MNATFEKLWNEYFAEECAKIDIEEDRALLKKAAELHKKTNELLTKEQNQIVEKYIETLYEIQSSFGKKAFFKGCEFTIFFLRGTGIAGKIHYRKFQRKHRCTCPKCGDSFGVSIK